MIKGKKFLITGGTGSLGKALTKKLLETDRPIQPSPYWLFNGRRLTDIYNETYE